MGDTESYAPGHTNVQVYKTPEKFFQMTLTCHGPKKGLDFVTEMANGARLKALYCEGVLNNKEILSEIRNADLIVGDAIYMCSSLIANKFSLPHVVILLETLCLRSMHAFGVPLAAPYVPQFKSTLTDDMSLEERLKNVYHWILVYWAFHCGMFLHFMNLRNGTTFHLFFFFFFLMNCFIYNFNTYITYSTSIIHTFTLTQYLLVTPLILTLLYNTVLK